jgi:hypothetical protein
VACNEVGGALMCAGSCSHSAHGRTDACGCRRCADDDEVLHKLEGLKQRFVVEQYGSLSLDPHRYPMYSVRTQDWSPTKPCVLITGGVHGYETSGVQGALLFLESEAEAYSKTFNILVA